LARAQDLPAAKPQTLGLSSERHRHRRATRHPKEEMIVVFMAQLHPTGDLALDREVNVLAYQAIID
jgi:hypothetical protein